MRFTTADDEHSVLLMREYVPPLLLKDVKHIPHVKETLLQNIGVTGFSGGECVCHVASPGGYKCF